MLLFFLLSGFVICYAHGDRGADAGGFRTYLVKRGRRIYPIFLLSLLLAYVVQCVAGRDLAPVHPWSLLGNMFMLQNHPDKPGAFVRPYADNMPLWSLSYEWWFYMMFYPINRCVPVRRQKFVVLGLCVAAMVANQFAPCTVFNILIFFVIWWTGVEFAREFLDTGNVTLKRQGIMLALLAVPAAWYGLLVVEAVGAGRKILFIKFPFVDFRYFLMSGVFIALVFVWKQWRFQGYRQTFGRFERLGSISFALYLVHYPILCDLRLLPGNAPGVFYTDLILRLLLAFGLAWLLERPLQKWINNTTNQWLVSTSPHSGLETDGMRNNPAAATGFKVTGRGK